jgi:hypothetical protein
MLSEPRLFGISQKPYQPVEKVTPTAECRFWFPTFGPIFIKKQHTRSKAAQL